MKGVLKDWIPAFAGMTDGEGDKRKIIFAFLICGGLGAALGLVARFGGLRKVDQGRAGLGILNEIATGPSGPRNDGMGTRNDRGDTMPAGTEKTSAVYTYDSGFFLFGRENSPHPALSQGEREKNADKGEGKEENPLKLVGKEMKNALPTTLSSSLEDMGVPIKLERMSNLDQINSSEEQSNGNSSGLVRGGKELHGAYPITETNARKISGMENFKKGIVAKNRIHDTGPGKKAVDTDSIGAREQLVRAGRLTPWAVLAQDPDLKLFLGGAFSTGSDIGPAMVKARDMGSRPPDAGGALAMSQTGFGIPQTDLANSGVGGAGSGSGGSGWAGIGGGGNSAALSPVNQLTDLTVSLAAIGTKGRVGPKTRNLKAKVKPTETNSISLLDYQKAYTTPGPGISVGK